MKVRVRDVEGSAKKWPKPKCACDSWIEHWGKNSIFDKDKIISILEQEKCPLCEKPITKDNPIVGAHVQKVASTDENYYIVPLCRSCNSSGNFSFDIDEDYLVRARKEYCITEII